MLCSSLEVHTASDAVLNGPGLCTSAPRPCHVAPAIHRSAAHPKPGTTSEDQAEGPEILSCGGLGQRAALEGRFPEPLNSGGAGICSRPHIFRRITETNLCKLGQAIARKTSRSKLNKSRLVVQRSQENRLAMQNRNTGRLVAHSRIMCASSWKKSVLNSVSEC